MPQENVETDLPLTELRAFEPRGTAMFRLSALDRGVWTLTQGRMPVALIRRSEVGHCVRTASGEWEAVVRRRGRVGWRLELARTGEPQATIHYMPPRLLHARRLEVPRSGRVFRLRAPFVRDDWRLTGTARGDTVHFDVREAGRVPASGRQVQLTTDLAEEPQIEGVVLASSVGIIVHKEQPHGGG